MREGWEFKKIGEICTLNTGGTPSRKNNEYFDGGEIKWLVSGDIHNNEIFDCSGRITEIGLKESNARYLPINSVMIALNGQGKTRGTVAMLRTEATCNQSLVSITPNDFNYLLPEFLYVNLHGRYDEIRKMTGDGGNDRRGLNMPIIRSIEIPIPPLSEQKQIVALLDKTFAAIDQAKANIEKNIENAKELFDNYLQNIFENPKDNWSKKKWGEICHFVRGPFGGSLKKSMFKENGYVVYEQKHAIHDHFNELRYFIDEEKFNEMIRFEVKPGDIIMSCSGVTLGRVAIIPQDIKRGIINQALLKLTPNDNVNVHFLKHWLRSNIFQEIIFEHSGGAAIPNVPSAKILKEILIPLPNLEELKKSILQKAFAGELISPERTKKDKDGIYSIGKDTIQVSPGRAK